MFKCWLTYLIVTVFTFVGLLFLVYCNNVFVKMGFLAKSRLAHFAHERFFFLVYGTKVFIQKPFSGG